MFHRVAVGPGGLGQPAGAAERTPARARARSARAGPGRRGAHTAHNTLIRAHGTMGGYFCSKCLMQLTPQKLNESNSKLSLGKL